MHHKTSFLRALRPFSLIVGLATCGLGVSLAWLDGFQHGELVALVLLAGLLLQIAVNLINDQRDLQDKTLPAPQQQAIRRNTRIGLAAMLAAILLGLYMVALRGWPLLPLGFAGVLGAWGYTGGTINYKARGLGVVLVFWLMGVMLIGGAYYVVSGTYNGAVFWLSVPFSLLSSLLLLSNELRDYEQDKADEVATLSVRIGYDRSVKLYYALITALYLGSLLLYLTNLINGIAILMLSALALIGPIGLLRKPQQQRIFLTPLTGRFYLVYSSLFMLTIWLPLP